LLARYDLKKKPGRPRGPITDYEFIVHEIIWEWDWYKALEELEKEGKKGLLLSLLRSSKELSRAVRVHLVDLLERYDFKKKRGRPRGPSYVRSDAECTALNVREQVRDLTKGGMSAKEAIARVAKDNNMSEDTVANAYEGRRGSTRRKQRMLKHDFDSLSVGTIPSYFEVIDLTIKDCRTKDGTS
jgi:hypothetical protein